MGQENGTIRSKAEPIAWGSPLKLYAADPPQSVSSRIVGPQNGRDQQMLSLREAGYARADFTSCEESALLAGRIIITVLQP